MKITFALLATFISLSSFSQIEKGKWFLGVNSNLNFRSTSQEYKNGATYASGHQSNDFSISPKAGYILFNNFIAGIDISLRFANYEVYASSLLEASSTQYIISPFLKYYFLKDKFKPFLKAQYGFGSKSVTNDNLLFIRSQFGETIHRNFSYSSNTENIEIGGGLAYFINNFVSIEITLNYISTTDTRENLYNTIDDKVTTSGFQSFIGFGVFL